MCFPPMAEEDTSGWGEKGGGTSNEANYAANFLYWAMPAILENATITLGEGGEYNVLPSYMV